MATALKPYDQQFFDWIITGVPGFCSVENARVIDACIQTMPDHGHVLEVGSYCGLSASIILNCLHRHERPHTLTTVDDWIYEGFRSGAVIGGQVTTDLWRAHLRRTFFNVLSLTAKGQRHWHYEGRSAEYFRTAKSAIAFAYIDGNHTYEGVKADFEGAMRLTLPGGLIFLDDTADDCPFEGRRFGQELEADERVERVFNNLCGNRCFRVRATPESARR